MGARRSLGIFFNKKKANWSANDVGNDEQRRVLSTAYRAFEAKLDCVCDCAQSVEQQAGFPTCPTLIQSFFLYNIHHGQKTKVP